MTTTYDRVKTTRHRGACASWLVDAVAVTDPPKRVRRRLLLVFLVRQLRCNRRAERGGLRSGLCCIRL
jgi:hypothetical protein